MKVTAYVLISVKGKEVLEVLDNLKASNFVRTAHAVTGPYDIIAFAEADDIPALGRLVTQQMRDFPGIDHTLSCVVLM